VAELRTPIAGHGPDRLPLCVIIAIALLSASPIHAQVIGIDCTGDLSASGGLDPVQSTDIMGVVRTWVAESTERPFPDLRLPA
jgi:hypothetical protein